MPKASNNKSKKPLRRFRIRGGTWLGDNGQFYYSGQVVETERDLARLHPSKFHDITEPEVVEEVHTIHEMDQVSPIRYNPAESGPQTADESSQDFTDQLDA